VDEMLQGLSVTFSLRILDLISRIFSHISNSVAMYFLVLDKEGVIGVCFVLYNLTSSWMY